MSRRPEAVQIYTDMRALAQQDLGAYFDRVGHYAQAYDGGAGLFASFAVEIERLAAEPSGQPPASDALRTPVAPKGYRDTVETANAIVDARIPDPSEEFLYAVGDTQLVRDRLHVKDTSPIDESLGVAGGVIDRGRVTLGNGTIETLAIVSELLKARGVDSPEEHARLVGPLGYNVIMGLAMSEDRLGRYVDQLDSMQEAAAERGVAVATGYRGWVLYQDRSRIVEQFGDQIGTIAVDDEIRRAQWANGPLVDISCPMTLIQERVFRPAYADVVRFAFSQGFEA